MNISYILAEELIETAEDASEKSIESSLGIDLFLAKQEYNLHNRGVSNFITSFFLCTQLPPYPHLDRVIPPPKG